MGKMGTRRSKRDPLGIYRMASSMPGPNVHKNRQAPGLRCWGSLDKIFKLLAVPIVREVWSDEESCLVGQIWSLAEARHAFARLYWA